ncbi:hypothetical protein H7F33_07740 [Pedobacter sp. PAMC26386]|nr:hypothetical protein H7F33_07740 [Pedobacter sp. PAMC26386]
MKKVLIAATSLIFLLLLAVFSLLQYRQYSSYKNRIHQNASLIFKINIDEIVKQKGFSSIKNDSRGFAVPANIFVYTLRNKSANTFFCSLPVTDTAELKLYLQRTFNIDYFNQTVQGTVWGNNSDQRLKIAYNTQTLALCYSFEKENVKDVLTELLNGKSFLAVTDPRIAKMKRQDAPVIYDFKTYSGQANFTGHTLTLKGTFPLNSLGVPDKAYCPAVFRKGLSINAWLNADLKGIFKKDIHFKDYVLERDTLLKYYHGYAALEAGNPINQYQPMVTYEYNDEFEKVEHIEQKKVKVPELTLALKGNAPALVNYLQEQSVISPDQWLNKELFPLYEVYSKNDYGTLQLSTSKIRLLPATRSASPYFIFAEIDFDKISKQNQFPLLNGYIRDLNKLELKATKQNEQTGKLELELKLNENAKL